MKYLRYFDTHTNYLDYMRGDSAVAPNVCYCDDREDVHINPWHQRIEYLESNGNQWIDLDFFANEATSMSGTCQYTNPGPQQYLFCIRDKWDVMFGFYLNGNTVFSYSFNNANHYKPTSVRGDTAKHTIVIPQSTTSGTVRFDNRTWTHSGGTRNNGSIRLFCAVGDFGRASVKLYSITFFQDGVPACDLIPVRIGNVGYVYDKISMKYYGNSGTVPFILGPDIPY